MTTDTENSRLLDMYLKILRGHTVIPLKVNKIFNWLASSYNFLKL